MSQSYLDQPSFYGGPNVSANPWKCGRIYFLTGLSLRQSLSLEGSGTYSRIGFKDVSSLIHGTVSSEFRGKGLTWDYCVFRAVKSWMDSVSSSNVQSTLNRFYQLLSNPSRHRLSPSYSASKACTTEAGLSFPENLYSPSTADFIFPGIQWMYEFGSALLKYHYSTF